MNLFQKYDGRPIIQYDPASKIQSLLDNGYKIENGKVKPAILSKTIDTPWIYVRPHPKFDCIYNTKILFNAFKVFPLSCLKCWKVVVRPRTIIELFQLLDLEENETERYCKCGVDKRDFVPGLYGGYFYNESKDEGLECLANVRELVAKNISPEIPVTLKRYCTEFELKFGPSDQIKETLQRGYFVHPDQGQVKVMKLGHMQTWTAIAKSIVELPFSQEPQAPWIRQHIIAEWFKWAWKYDKENVEKFFGDQPMVTPSVTYEP